MKILKNINLKYKNIKKSIFIKNTFETQKQMSFRECLEI